MGPRYGVGGIIPVGGGYVIVLACEGWVDTLWELWLLLMGGDGLF